MKKAWLSKLNHSPLGKKTPLLGFSVLQVAILFAVIGGGTATVLVSQHLKQTPPNTTSNLPAYSTNTQTTASAINTAPQSSNAANKSASTTSKPAKSATPTASTALPDQYGCIPQTSGYDSCVKAAKQNALTLSCDSQAKSAGDTYSAAESQAQAAYNAVMADWATAQERQKNYPPQLQEPYSSFATDAKTKYNAIEKPAYATYTSTISTLNAQGCKEILVYSDTSWAGY